MSQTPHPRFAALPDAAAPRDRSFFARFFFAPFGDVDDRVLRLAAASRAEREARQAASAMSDAARSPRD